MGWLIFPIRPGTPASPAAVGDPGASPTQVIFKAGSSPSDPLPIGATPPADGYVGQVASIAQLAGKAGVLGVWNFTSAPTS